MTLLSWLLATVIVGGCLAASARQWRSVAKSRGPAPELVARIRRASASDLVDFSRSLPAESGVRELLQAVEQASSRSHAVARINEQLGEIESHLGSGQAISSSAGRIAAFTGLLFATVELARTVASGEGPAWQSSAAFAVLGASGALVVRLFGRSAERIARERRAAWNDLVHILARRLNDRFPE